MRPKPDNAFEKLEFAYRPRGREAIVGLFTYLLLAGIVALAGRSYVRLGASDILVKEGFVKRSFQLKDIQEIQWSQDEGGRFLKLISGRAEQVVREQFMEGSEAYLLLYSELLARHAAATLP